MNYPGPSQNDETFIRAFFSALVRSVVLAVIVLAVLAVFTEARAETFTAADYAVMGIDAPTVLAVWTWGFGTVIFSWYLGYVAGVALTAIRKA